MGWCCGTGTFLQCTLHVYGSLWRLKHWLVRQIKPAQLDFGRTLIYLLTYLQVYDHCQLSKLSFQL